MCFTRWFREHGHSNATATSDNKVAVRKTAILALEVLSNIGEDSIDIEVSIYQY